MAIKLTDIAEKLKMTKLQLKRKLRNLDIENLDSKGSFFEKKVADQILEKLGEKKKEKKVKEKIKPEDKEKNLVAIPSTITVKNFAGKLNLPVTDIIKELLRNGVAATINEKIDFETAAIIAGSLGYQAEEEEEKEPSLEDQWKGQKLESRPPVVTVLGHVDHGKTTLLDRIRKESVVDTESGGITQHIGAYQALVEVEGKKRKITFIDTPGHKAFTAMRAQGAKVTDIAILVVAAEDSVKPQTKEALDHIKEAGVPVVVAINKIDLANADVGKVKRDLTKFGLTPEELGGTTPMIEISAKKGTNVKELLEIVVLTADLQDLKAPFRGKMKGVVIESHMHKGSGALATILIKQGILHQGDVLVADTTPATARILENERMEHIKKAEPSQPIRVVGFKEVPPVGVIVEKVKDMKEAREICQERLEEARKEGRTSGTGLIEAAKSIRQGKMTKLKIILKADVAGSLEALKQSIEVLGNKQVGIDIILAGVGPVNESDIEMATASRAVIISFRMSIDQAAKVLAKQNNIEISNYDVIYQLLDELKATLKGLRKPKIVREEIGQAKILKVFFSTKKRKIIGCRVTSGQAVKKLSILVKREEEEIGQGEVDSLKIEDKEVETVKSGTDCGIGIKTDIKLKEGDILEFYQEKKVIEKIK